MAFQRGPQADQFIPTQQIVLGVALIFILGLVTGALPALQARRLRIVDALRRA